jgi:hypothetical protein
MTQPEQQLARIALPKKIVEDQEVDRTQQPLIEILGFERADVEIVAGEGRTAERILAEYDVARGRGQSGVAGIRHGGRSGRLGVRPDQKIRQCDVSGNRRGAGHPGECNEVQRRIVAGADDVEQNRFVARLGGAAVDIVVARVDGVIDRRAGAENPGQQPTGKPHPHPTLHARDPNPHKRLVNCYD